MYPKLAQFKHPTALRQRLAELGLDLPVDERPLSAAEGSPLAGGWSCGSWVVGNRWCIHPMEGWDGTAEGFPTADTLRRWRRFGLSGAKLIWGGEAAAVRADGRANPRQIMATPSHLSGLARLREELVAAHRDACGDDRGLVVGLQLTHSGRFSRPSGPALEPRLAFRHPLLDAKFGLTSAADDVLWSDAELDDLVGDYAAAARTAREAGFDFVDVKACHGYLIHELLAARDRPGAYGGDLAGRSRFLRRVIAEIQGLGPGLAIGVRLSLFDVVPFVPGRLVGEPHDYRAQLPYTFGFGVAQDRPTEPDLAEPLALVAQLADWGVALLNATAGSPYYSHHVQRPAIFPPSDGYLPPEDPLVGVVRQIQATRLVKQAVPQLPVVGTGYTYLQDFLPHVAQAVVRAGWVDAVGLGRMVLSYPELPRDVLAGRPLARRRICRTFSDCTTAPRNALVSGCYPLDEHYHDRAEGEVLRALKVRIRRQKPALE